MTFRYNPTEIGICHNDKSPAKKVKKRKSKSEPNIKYSTGTIWNFPPTANNGNIKHWD